MSFVPLKSESGTPSDEELMIAVSRGEIAAFEYLVLRHQISAWNAAYRFLGDSTEAEDVAQEAFMKVFQAAPRYQPTATFRTYLYRIVTRLCIDRSEKKRPHYSEDLSDSPDDHLSPFHQIERNERQAQIRKALDRLPEKQRMVVILKYFEGLGYAEIADALETTPKAVERMLARARETLEAFLLPLCD